MVKWMGFLGFLKEEEEGKESLFGLWRSKRKILEAAAMAMGDWKQLVWNWGLSTM